MTKSTEKNPILNTIYNIDDAMCAVRDTIREKLLSSPIVIRSFTKHLAKTNGKNIRAYSLITAAQSSDGTVDSDAVLLAVAIEFLHLATLVHDDVIDDAKTRRGAETIQSKFGKRPAVICGDYLFCVALQTAAEISPQQYEKAGTILPAYMTEVCLGELMQNQNNKNLDLTAAKYYKIIAGKTAALFEASFYGGFLFCGETESHAELYKRLGHHIGMIFQLSDDCADYEHSYEQTKKPVKSDFEQGVITLPLIYALNQEQTLRPRVLAGISAKQAVEAVRKSGGLIFTRSIIKKHYKKADTIINSLEISAEKRERLKQILEKSTNNITF